MKRTRAELADFAAMAFDVRLRADGETIDRLVERKARAIPVSQRLTIISQLSRSAPWSLRGRRRWRGERRSLARGPEPRFFLDQVRGVNRVVYDVSSKPPGTIEWE